MQRERTIPHSNVERRDESLSQEYYSHRSLEIAELPLRSFLRAPPYLRCVSRQRFCKRCFLAQISGDHLSERERERGALLRIAGAYNSRQSRKPARRILGLFNYINRDLYRAQQYFSRDI